MLFNIERDEGDVVVGYIVPDAYTAIPRLSIRAAGRVLLDMEANEVRDALVVAGRHETGRCGFRIDDALTPGLRDIADLEIVESGSGVLVYRRRRPQAIGRKIIRLETGMLPMRQVDQSLAPHFQYHMSRVELLGRETVTQMMMLNHVDSQYISGRINFVNFDQFAEKEFKTWIILTKPYEALAEQIMLLRHIRKTGLSSLGERDALAFVPAIHFAESLDIEDDKALKASFRKIDEAAASLLSNPLVRQLTCATPDEMPRSGAVAAALDMLSRCEVVASRSDPDEFVELAAASLGLEAERLAAPSRFSVVCALAERIERTGAAEPLIEKDLELHYYIDRARQRVETP